MLVVLWSIHSRVRLSMLSCERYPRLCHVISDFSSPARKCLESQWRHLCVLVSFGLSDSSKLFSIRCSKFLRHDLASASLHLMTAPESRATSTNEQRRKKKIRRNFPALIFPLFIKQVTNDYFWIWLGSRAVWDRLEVLGMCRFSFHMIARTAELQLLWKQHFRRQCFLVLRGPCKVLRAFSLLKTFTFLGPVVRKPINLIQD